MAWLIVTLLINIVNSKHSEGEDSKLDKAQDDVTKAIGSRKTANAGARPPLLKRDEEQHGKRQPCSPTSILSPRLGSEPSTGCSTSPCDSASTSPKACAPAPPSAFPHHPAHTLEAVLSMGEPCCSRGTPVFDEQKSEEGDRWGATEAVMLPYGRRLVRRSGMSGGTKELQPLLRMLRDPAISGQECAWGWEHAALLCSQRPTISVELSTALWCSVHAAAGRFSSEPHSVAMESLLSYSLPMAVKRMEEQELTQVARLCKDIAEQRSCHGYTSRDGASTRDCVQPIFAMVAAEVAWRCSSRVPSVSTHTLLTLTQCSWAWSWQLIGQRDSSKLAALKQANAEALHVLHEHLVDSCFTRRGIC